MAEAPALFTQCARQEEILSLPQGPWPLHERLPRSEGAYRGAHLEREVTEICQKGDFNRSKDNNKDKHEALPRDEDHASHRP